MTTTLILLYKNKLTAFNFGPIFIPWYGLSYVVSIFIGWKYAKWLIRNRSSLITNDHLDNSLPWIVGGLVIGGRLGEILLYDFTYYLKTPSKLISILNQGMSFHGGLLGVIIATFIFCKKKRYRYYLLGISFQLV